MKRIVLTGGGTAGHVTPNIALLPKLRELGYDIHYIGSYEGIEKKLIEDVNVPYYGIASGKLRRYFDPKNFSDPFRVLKGYGEARKILKKLKPDVVFSKGGFVAVPVVLAAKHLHIPVIIHESDMTPGLANKISLSAATKVCCNFPETMGYIPEGKAVLTGSPIREELLHGNKLAALNLCGFAANKLLKKYQVIHLCGKGKLDSTKTDMEGYIQFEYVKKELADLFALADVCISRAGANAICELLALRKPNLLIPLSANASRGDQILNAESFENQGFSEVLTEENLAPTIILPIIDKLYEKRADYVAAMEKSGQSDAISKITSLIEEVTSGKN